MKIFPSVNALLLLSLPFLSIRVLQKKSQKIRKFYHEKKYVPIAMAKPATALSASKHQATVQASPSRGNDWTKKVQ